MIYVYCFILRTAFVTTRSRYVNGFLIAEHKTIRKLTIDGALF